MYAFLLVLQYITIFGLIFQCIVVFQKWSSKLHAYLFLGSVATLVSNAGYLMQMRSVTEDGCFNALTISYMGKVWIPLALFMFSMEMGHETVPQMACIVLM